MFISSRLLIPVAVTTFTVVALISFMLDSSEARANHGSVVHNATEKKDTTEAWGSYAVISGTNPNLHGGQWTYHRTAACRTVNGIQCERYAEIGWWKKSPNTFNGLIVWDDGTVPQTKEFSYTSGIDHTFANQYNPNDFKYHWFYDGGWIWSAPLGFNQTSSVTCGGEVATGVEGMGDTPCKDNRWLKRNPDGTFVYVSWGGHVNYVDDLLITTQI